MSHPILNTGIITKISPEDHPEMVKAKMSANFLSIVKADEALQSQDQSFINPNDDQPLHLDDSRMHPASTDIRFLSKQDDGRHSAHRDRRCTPDAPTDKNLLGYVMIGDTPIPTVEPNINPRTEIQDIEKALKSSRNGGFSCCDIMNMALTSMTIVGSFFVCKNTMLVNSNEYGFIIDSGKVVFLRPGWHYLGSPFMTGRVRHDISSEYINVSNFQLIRIRQDEVGIGVDNTNMEVLLPGTHLRTNAAYKLLKRCKLSQDINEGPIKILTVRTGTVHICYDNGAAQILTEGRYAVNSNGFIVGNTLDITQQNIKFTEHKVLLEGGVNMLVEGLLTYQVIDVVKLIQNVDYEKLNKYLEGIMEADLTKVFSTIHLEQISSSTYSELKRSDEGVAETRLHIYESIMKLIKPQADQWGIKIINFQLESIRLASENYGRDYEAASLQIAKSKAELRTQEAQNLIERQKAETQANINNILAETESTTQLIRARTAADSTIIEAEAKAEAIMKEGQAKATAADLMNSDYGQELALLEQKSKIAEGLKIHTLVMGGDGKAGGNQFKINKAILAQRV